MFVLVGTRTKNHESGSIYNVPCPHCGNTTTFGLYKNATALTIFFIPTFRFTNSAFARCNGCGAAFSIGKKDLKNVHSAADLLAAIENNRNKK